ncbi:MULTISPECIES: hypothetical protein [unclassified Burkholderia]|uniref:hypothetical protein n=1 Tax=unclassified Burkholderia TaxID=2613784 RepID=UPI00141EC8A6|nr:MULTISPECIES: hypothetical protein [unclassified Burkholderia]
MLLGGMLLGGMLLGGMLLGGMLLGGMLLGGMLLGGMLLGGILLGVILLGVILLGVILLGVILLGVILLGGILLGGILLGVILLGGILLGGIAASVCCLASRSPGTGFRCGREATFVTRRLSLAVYAHKRSAWIARRVDVRRSSGISRCCIPSQGVPLTNYDQKHLPSRHDRAPRFPRRVYAHKLSSSQPTRLHRAIGQCTRHARQLATHTDDTTWNPTESLTDLSGIRYTMRSSHQPSSVRLCA